MKDSTGTDSTGTDSAVVLAVLDSGAPKLLPRDEANASFQQFRSQLLDALARRDTTFLYSAVAPGIKNSFGGDDGIEGFKRLWKMNEPGTVVWAALTRVLSMGGQQTSDSSFTAPYVFAFWPDSMDSFENVAIVGENVRIYETPATSSRVLGTATYSILRVRGWKGLATVPGDSTWAQVRLPSGVTGWIRGVDVQSPVSWRAMFVRKGDQWQMVFFVAGD